MSGRAVVYVPEPLPVGAFDVRALPGPGKRRYELVIDTLPDGQHLAFPALVVTGARAGKTLLVCGAVHGDEYEGTVAIQDVFETLDPTALRGSFVGIPVVNGPAFAAARREGPWDGLNLARVFPGDAAGSPTLRIAHAFRAHVLPQADLLLDIHSGGNAYAIYHFAGYQLREGEVGRVQREAAIAFGAPLVWGTAALPGRTLSAAGELGIPAVYVEMRGEGRCRPADRARAVEGVRRVMAYLGMVDEPYPGEPTPAIVEDPRPGSGHLQADHPSPTGGLFVPRVDLWDAVTAGQLLGEVRHPDGTVLATIPAARAGRVLFLRTLPRVFAGDALAFVLPLPTAGTGGPDRGDDVTP
jgi:predicted deacylase